MLISRAQHKQAENFEARARNAEAQRDMFQARAAKGDSQKCEFARQAREAELCLQQLEKEVSSFRSGK